MHSTSMQHLGQSRRLGCSNITVKHFHAICGSKKAVAVRSGSSLGHACTHTAAVRVQAMQSGWQPQQPQQPVPNRQPAPLTRTPYPASPVFLELTQVLNKQVVTRTSGRSLGTISGAWLDPARGMLVSFDLDDRKPGSGTVLSSPARSGNIPLSALRQIGDVVLVHDESGLYEQDLDGRLGFVNPVGLDVRTRTGEFLGKVRDLSFSPDTGAISRVTYDEFGLPFLPISFFDCYSVAMQDVLSIGRGDIFVYDDAKYRERKESNGLFAAIPSLFKSLNAPRTGSPQLALPAPSSTSDMYRLGSGSTTASSGRYLPADYTYEQWQADLRRWEAETGMTYEQYLRSQSQQAQPRAALPPATSAAQQPGYAGSSSYTSPQQYGQPQAQPGYVQQQQPQSPYGQQYGQLPQQRPGQMLQQQQQQPLQQQQQPQQQQGYGVRQARPVQQQYGTAAQPAGTAFGTQPGAAAGAIGLNPYATPRYNPAAAAGQGMGFGANPAAAAGDVAGQQQRAPQQPQQQQPLSQQQARPAQQQQQQPQRNTAPAGAAGFNTVMGGRTKVAGTAATGAAAGWAQQQQPGMQQQQAAQQQQQPPQQQQQSGRPVDDWLVKESKPRMADALAEGVLPLNEDGAAQQQQAQQQEVA